MRLYYLSFLSLFFLAIVGVYTYPSQAVTYLTHSDWELNEAPSIAAEENIVYVVWNCWHSEFESKIYCTYSTDQGKTWRNATCLSPNSRIATSPKVVLINKTAHIVWKEFSYGYPEIFYINGTWKNWSKALQLTYDNPRKNNIYDVNIGVAENDTIYLVWKDYRTGSSEIFFKRRNNYVWEEDKRLTYDYTPSYNPSASSYKNKIFVVWEDWGLGTRICMMKSEDSGVSWSEKEYLTTDGDSERPDVAVEKDNVYITWKMKIDGDSRICFISSYDGGKTWNDIYTIAKGSNNINPKISVHNDTVVVVWQSRKEDRYDICMKVSFNKGKNWSDIINLTRGSINAYDVSIYLSNNILYTVWQDYHEASYSDICYASFHLVQLPIPSVEIYMEDYDRITVDVFANNISSSDVSTLGCVVEYKDREGNWIPINVSFCSNHWTGHVNVSSEMEDLELYTFRAKFVNSVGMESPWQYANVQLESKNKAPFLEVGFVLLVMILVLFIRSVRKL